MSELGQEPKPTTDWQVLCLLLIGAMMIGTMGFTALTLSWQDAMEQQQQSIKACQATLKKLQTSSVRGGF